MCMLLDRLSKSENKCNNWRLQRQLIKVDESGHNPTHMAQLQAKKARLRLEAEEMQRKEVRGSKNNIICIFHHVC